jgi:hypothetical protein
MRFLTNENDTVVNSTTPNLFDHANASDWNQNPTDDGPKYAIPGSDSSVNSFFILPAMGLLVLIVGSIYMRRNRINQSRRSSEISDARTRAHHERILQRKALRLQMVKNALITTKVVTCNHDSSNRRGSFAMTECTTTSIDSSNSSSADLAMEDLESPTDQNTDDPVMTLEHPIDVEGWKLDSCSICLESYQENESVSYSKHQNCSHCFHTGCIMNWLQDEHRNDCPYCRSQFVHVYAIEPESDLYLETSGSSAMMTENPTSEQHSVMIADEEQADANSNAEDVRE